MDALRVDRLQNRDAPTLRRTLQNGRGGPGPLDQPKKEISAVLQRAHKAGIVSDHELKACWQVTGTNIFCRHPLALSDHGTNSKPELETTGDMRLAELKKMFRDI